MKNDNNRNDYKESIHEDEEGHENHEIVAKQEDGELPFLDQLLKNPLHFSPLSASVSTTMDEDDHPGISVTDDSTTHTRSITHVNDDNNIKDMKENSFCKPMMMMMRSSPMEMAEHGVGFHPMVSSNMDMSKGMVMYMDGFRFAMAGGHPCLNLYFPSWTLDTRTKFVGCLLVVFLLSFATEGISKYRHLLSSKPTGRDLNSRRTRQITISALHGVQALLGYVVMLATMTFSLEILLAVVLGLSTGYYYYFAGEIGLEGHVTTNPCCSYMQDESDEHEQRQAQAQIGAAATEDGMTTGLLAAAEPTSNV